MMFQEYRNVVIPNLPPDSFLINCMNYEILFFANADFITSNISLIIHFKQFL